MGELQTISWRLFEKFLFSQGCTLIHIRGDHLMYGREGLARKIVVPKIRNIPEFIIRNNLRVLGVNTRYFLKILRDF